MVSVTAPPCPRCSLLGCWWQTGHWGAGASTRHSVLRTPAHNTRKTLLREQTPLLLHNTGPRPRASDPLNIKCFCPRANCFLITPVSFMHWKRILYSLLHKRATYHLSGASDAYVMETWGLSELDIHIKCMFSLCVTRDTCDNKAADVMTHCVTQPPGGWRTQGAIQRYRYLGTSAEILPALCTFRQIICLARSLHGKYGFESEAGSEYYYIVDKLWLNNADIEHRHLLSQKHTTVSPLSTNEITYLLHVLWLI